MENIRTYAILMKSPLMVEALKIIEAQPGCLNEIAGRLHRRAPTAHRALTKLCAVKLARVRHEGRRAQYWIPEQKKAEVTRIVQKLYHPTKTMVVGELKVVASGKMKLDEHLAPELKSSFDVVYRGAGGIAAVMVLDALTLSTLPVTVGKIVQAFADSPGGSPLKYVAVVSVSDAKALRKGSASNLIRIFDRAGVKVSIHVIRRGGIAADIGRVQSEAERMTAGNPEA